MALYVMPNIRCIELLGMLGGAIDDVKSISRRCRLNKLGDVLGRTQQVGSAAVHFPVCGCIRCPGAIVNRDRATSGAVLMGLVKRFENPTPIFDSSFLARNDLNRELAIARIAKISDTVF